MMDKKRFNGFRRPLAMALAAALMAASVPASTVSASAADSEVVGMSEIPMRAEDPKEAKEEHANASKEKQEDSRAGSGQEETGEGMDVLTEAEGLLEAEGMEAELPFSDDDIRHGIVDEEYGHLAWKVDKDGKLTVKGTGDWTDHDPNSDSDFPGHFTPPWNNGSWNGKPFGTSIRSAVIQVTGMTEASNLFLECTNLTSVDLSGFDTTSVTYMSGMFSGCSSLTSLDLSGFDTKNVTDMGGMFSGCSGLTSLDVSGFDTKNVTDMGWMFSGCSGLTSLDLSGFDTKNVTDMEFMFGGCKGLASLNLSGFDTKSVTNMEDMFYDCSSLTSLDLSRFDTTAVADMSGMFNGCSGLTSLDLSGFDTKSVTDMSYMFALCPELISLNLSGFDTKSVTDMSHMFNYCPGLTSLDLSGFDTKSVTDMEAMFSECHGLASLDLSSFDTSSVIDIRYIFENCYNLSRLNTPLNLKWEVPLPMPKTGPGEWYMPDGAPVTALPMNLAQSVLITRIPGNEEPEPAGTAEIVVVKPADKKIRVAAGKTFQIGVEVKDKSDSSKKLSPSVHYSIEKGKEAFAEVSSTGLVTGKKAGGSAKITISAVVEGYQPIAPAVIDLTVTASTEPGTDPSKPSPEPGKPGTDDSAQEVVIQVKSRTITKPIGSKPFSLGASMAGGGKLSYTSSSKKVVTVSSKGKVTAKGIGSATVTIKSGESKKAASVKVRITITPKKASLSSAKSTKKTQATVKWKKDKDASGYQLTYAASKDFKGAKNKAISSGKKVSCTLTKLKKGKTYYVKLRSYKNVKGKKIYGPYSSVKKVKIKK